MGRKPKGSRALTGAERQRAYRERRRKATGVEFVEKMWDLYLEYRKKLTDEEMVRAVKFLRGTVLPLWERGDGEQDSGDLDEIA